ncbi:hypothetical protein [Kinneretia aquatilis]|uniref:hypothetical protein n=1 Tax=Kinneretia aquatilis TaxID=2070761 RepID=UPI0013FD1B5E
MTKEAPPIGSSGERSRQNPACLIRKSPAAFAGLPKPFIFSPPHLSCLVGWHPTPIDDALKLFFFYCLIFNANTVQVETRVFAPFVRIGKQIESKTKSYLQIAMHLKTDKAKQSSGHPQGGGVHGIELGHRQSQASTEIDRAFGSRKSGRIQPVVATPPG